MSLFSLGCKVYSVKCNVDCKSHLRNSPQVAFILVNDDISIYIILSTLLFTLPLPNPIRSPYETFIIHYAFVGK
jgi:hypothetical protein